MSSTWSIYLKKKNVIVKEMIMHRERMMKDIELVWLIVIILNEVINMYVLMIN